MAALRVTQVRSSIGIKPKHRGTLRALGLGRIGKTHTLPDRPEIRGMLARVPHLVRVDDVDDQDKTSSKRRSRAKQRPTNASAEPTPRERGVGTAAGGAADGGTSPEAKHDDEERKTS
jgi:large subunit ribosomal protein L30